MGIFKGSGLKLFSSPRFQSDYNLLSDREITALHRRLVGLFKTLPHGPFQALCEMVGEKQARVFGGASYRECALPDSKQNNQLGESSRPAKRPRLAEQEIIDLVSD
jgi:hypothetical protein